MALLKTTSQRGKQGFSSTSKNKASVKSPTPKVGSTFTQNRGQVYKDSKLVANYGIGEQAAQQAQAQVAEYQNGGRNVKYGVNTESFYSPEARASRALAKSTSRSTSSTGSPRPALSSRAPVARNLAGEQDALRSALGSNTKGGANTGIANGTDINSLSPAQKSLLQEQVNMRTYGTARPVFTSAESSTGTTTGSDTASGTADGTVNGAVDTSTNGTTASNTGAPMSVNRPVYDGTSQDATGSTFDSSMPEAPKTLQEIRQDTLARSQEMVNATEAYFTSQLQGLAQEAQQQQARYGSMLVGAGLAGSPFQQTINNNIQQQQDQQSSEIKARRSAEVAGYVNDAYNRADTLYQQGLDEYQQERDFAISERDKAILQQEKKQEATKKAALETIGNIASGGYSLDEMPEQDYQKLLKDSGMSDFEARAIWAAKTPQANASYSVSGDYMVQQYFDPHTGKAVIKTTKLPPELISAKVADIKTITTGDGQVYWYDANNPINADGSPNFAAIGGIKDTSGGDFLGSTVSEFGRTKDSKYLTDAGKLADDFSSNAVVKNFATQQEGYQYASTYDPNTKNPYESQALIFAFMKVLDPTSVVREGEFATAQKNTSLLSQFGITLNNIAGRELITSGQSNQILNALKTRYASSESGYNNVVKQFTTRAQNFGIDPEDVVTDYGITGDFSGVDAGEGNSDIQSYIKDARSQGQTDEQILQDLQSIGAYELPSDQSIDPTATLNSFSYAPSTAVNGSNAQKVSTLASAKSPGSYGGQCGRFVNQHTGLGVGDSYASKMAKTNPSIKVPQPGDVFVTPYKSTGHIGFVKAVKPLPDGSYELTVLDSNYHLNERVDVHTINSRKVSGYARVPLKIA